MHTNTRPQQMVQPILVDGTLSHEDTVYYGAKASVLGMLNPDARDAYKKWLDGSFTKSVRKISHPKLQGFLDGSTHISGVTYLIDNRGKVASCSAPPAFYSDMDKEILRGRVAGLDLPRSGNYPQPHSYCPILLINSDLKMSTGKTTAQVAHGWMAYMLKQKPLEEWTEQDLIPDMYIKECKEGFIKELTGAPVIIRDAGYTEIEPGSLTVVVL